jgi:hypothetical protein
MPKDRIFPALALATLALAVGVRAQDAGPPSSTAGKAATPSPSPMPGPAGAPGQGQAQAVPPPPPLTSPHAEQALDEALRKVKAYKSVSAELSEDVSLLGQKFRLTGRYLRAPGSRVLLRLDVEGLGDAEGTVLQVCDGTVLWDFMKIMGAPSCRSIKVGEVFKKLDSPDCDAELRERTMAQLGFAGPDALLAGLRKSVAFYTKTEGTIDGKKVWVLGGQWKDREALSGPGQPPLPPTASLPPYIPNTVIVSVGQDDGWPYRVELIGRAPSLVELQRDSRPIGPDGRPMGPKTTPKREEPCRIILVYSKVQLDQAIPPAEFAFEPPQNVPKADATEALLNQLENLLADRANQRRMEAAKGGGEVPAIQLKPSPSPAPGGGGGGDTFRSTTPPPG